MVRGDHDCALQIDVTERGSNIFDGDIDLLIGFAAQRRDRDWLVARLNAATCMVTMQMQVVSYSDESAVEHVLDTLSRLHSGLAVYEGGIFNIPEPTHPWVAKAIDVLGGIGGKRGEQ